MKFSRSLPHWSAITKVSGGWRKSIKASKCALECKRDDSLPLKSNVFMCPTVKSVPASYLLDLENRRNKSTIKIENTLLQKSKSDHNNNGTNIFLTWN